MKHWDAYSHYGCFALGSWIGGVGAFIAEGRWRDLPAESDGVRLPIGLSIALLVPTCLLLATVFLAWLVLRLRGGPVKISGLATLGLGVAYFPLLFAWIAISIWITGQGQGTLVGSSIALGLFGLPLAAGELVVRLTKSAAAGAPAPLTESH